MAVNYNCCEIEKKKKRNAATTRLLQQKHRGLYLQLRLWNSLIYIGACNFSFFYFFNFVHACRCCLWICELAEIDDGSSLRCLDASGTNNKCKGSL